MAGAIGLVERGLEDDRQVEIARDPRDPLRVAERRFEAFDHAWTRDYGESRAAEDCAAGVDLKRIHQALRNARTFERSEGRAALKVIAARIRPRNSGWHSSGRDLSSGWNWQPRN